jgi:tetratricopeptide (TPR) repeat protein
MAPEQLLGEAIDTRTDIHAAGFVLYEMATGHRPFADVEPSRRIGAILRRLPRPPTALNPRLSPELERIIGKCLEKDPGKRYQTAVELAIDLRRLAKGDVPLAAPLVLAVMLVVPATRHRIASQAVAAWPRVTGLNVPPITEKDYILVSDFSNQTGDPVFDGTLRKALALDLDQSPYLNVISDQRIAQALRLMGHDPGDKLPPEVGSDLCQRNGIKALVVGDIVTIGNDYLLSVQAIDAATGEVLVQDQERASSREQVLQTIDLATSKLRERLGESLASIRKFDKRLPEATTSSLEALRALALGDTKHFSAYEMDSIGLYKRALEIDPNFALAWARLAMVYSNLGDDPDYQEALKHAYALKDRVSERERLYILGASPDLTERRAGLELYRSTYPRDPIPYVALSDIDSEPQGENDLLQAIRLDSSMALAYSDLVELYVTRGDATKARRTCDDGLHHVPDSPLLARECYKAALAAHDDTALQEADTALKASREGRASLAEMKQYLAFARGKIRRSREINQQLLETLNATYLHSLILTKLLPYLRLQLAAGFKISVSEQLRAHPGLAAHSVPALLALAEAGETQAAEKLKTEIIKDDHSASAKYVLSLLASRSAQWSQAAALLQGTDQLPDPFVRWYSGSIYLASGQPAQARASFNQLLESTTTNTPFYPWSAFAHVGLARCYMQEKELSRARAEYEEAFKLWNDADPDIPVLKKARVEYERIHQK